jgi:hypothetical protein
VDLPDIAIEKLELAKKFGTVYSSKKRFSRRKIMSLLKN